MVNDLYVTEVTSIAAFPWFVVILCPMSEESDISETKWIVGPHLSTFQFRLRWRRRNWVRDTDPQLSGDVTTQFAISRSLQTSPENLWCLKNPPPSSSLSTCSTTTGRQRYGCHGKLNMAMESINDEKSTSRVQDYYSKGVQSDVHFSIPRVLKTLVFK